MNGFRAGILALLCAAASTAWQARADLADWEIVPTKGKGSALLRHRQNLKLTLRLMSDIRGRPEIKSVKMMTENKTIECITYYAGDFGTSSLESVYRAVLYDTKAKEFIGDFPIAAPEPAANAKHDPFAPVWSESPGRIIIDEPQAPEKSVARTEIDLGSGDITTMDIELPAIRRLTAD